MQMAATTAAAGVRQHHHAGGGGGGSGTKGVARRHGAVVHEGLRDEGGARVAPGAGDSKLRSKDGWAKRGVRRATKQ